MCPVAKFNIGQNFLIPDFLSLKCIPTSLFLWKPQFPSKKHQPHCPLSTNQLFCPHTKFNQISLFIIPREQNLVTWVCYGTKWHRDKYRHKNRRRVRVMDTRTDRVYGWWTQEQTECTGDGHKNRPSVRVMDTRTDPVYGWCPQEQTLCTGDGYKNRPSVRVMDTKTDRVYGWWTQEQTECTGDGHKNWPRARVMDTRTDRVYRWCPL